MILRLVIALVVLAAVPIACGSENEPADAGGSGVRVVTPEAGAELIAEPSMNVMILDVRTPEEFADGHLEGATLIDFYDNDFAEQIARLDPEGSYLIYCRSGNRSSQARTLMADLGFTDVADVEGGILAWADAGLPLVR